MRKFPAQGFRKTFRIQFFFKAMDDKLVKIDTVQRRIHMCRKIKHAGFLIQHERGRAVIKRRRMI